MTIFTDLFARKTDVDGSIVAVSLCEFLEKARDKMDYDLTRVSRGINQVCVLVKLSGLDYVLAQNSADADLLVNIKDPTKTYKLIMPDDKGKVGSIESLYAIDPRPVVIESKKMVERLLLRRKAREAVKKIYQKPRQYR